ncbi:MAG: DUF421 domain-containing protein [Actinobacteria bacterium]|nr:DUF421 domain-containing protein [Actinomycetota bacterium]
MLTLASTVANDLFVMQIPLVDKVIRTVAVYLGLLILLRLAGKRDLAQLNTFDLVVLLLLSNVVQNAIIGPDNSLLGGLIGAMILVVGNAVMVRATARSAAITSMVEGRPTVVIQSGALHEANVRRLGLRGNDIIAAVRRQGANNIDEVELATLGPGGAIEMTLRVDCENATKGDLARLEAKVDALLETLGPPAT